MFQHSKLVQPADNGSRRACVFSRQFRHAATFVVGFFQLLLFISRPSFVGARMLTPLRDAGCLGSRLPRKERHDRVERSMQVCDVLFIEDESESALAPLTRELR